MGETQLDAGGEQAFVPGQGDAMEDVVLRDLHKESSGGEERDLVGIEADDDRAFQLVRAVDQAVAECFPDGLPGPGRGLRAHFFHQLLALVDQVSACRLLRTQLQPVRVGEYQNPRQRRALVGVQQGERCEVSVRIQESQGLEAVLLQGDAFPFQGAERQALAGGFRILEGDLFRRRFVLLFFLCHI